MANLWVPGMPREDEAAAQLARIGQTHDDRAAARFLQSGRRAQTLNGSPLPRHMYRQICGHVFEVHGTALPTKTRTRYCGDDACRCEREVVEHLCLEADARAPLGGV